MEGRVYFPAHSILQHNTCPREQEEAQWVSYSLYFALNWSFCVAVLNCCFYAPLFTRTMRTLWTYFSPGCFHLAHKLQTQFVSFLAFQVVVVKTLVNIDSLFQRKLMVSNSKLWPMPMEMVWTIWLLKYRYILEILLWKYYSVTVWIKLISFPRRIRFLMWTASKRRSLKEDWDHTWGASIEF